MPFTLYTCKYPPSFLGWHETIKIIGLLLLTGSFLILQKNIHVLEAVVFV